MMGGAKAHYDGIRAFSETDFTEDLKIIDVPTLVMHGDDDQIVPITDSALLSAKLLRKGTLKSFAESSAESVIGTIWSSSITDSALLSAKLLRKGTLKVYEKFPHGMCTTHADVVNTDLFTFIKS